MKTPLQHRCLTSYQGNGAVEPGSGATKAAAAESASPNNKAQARNISANLQLENVWNGIDRDEAPPALILVELPGSRQLHGSVIELDSTVLNVDNVYFKPDPDPKVFWKNISPVLNRHPVYRFAEVRTTGKGLYLIVWLSPIVDITSEFWSRHWEVNLRTVQRTLMDEPNMRSIIAMARPIGAFDCEKGAIGEILQKGSPVDPEIIDEFVDQLLASPFKKLAQLLYGSDCVKPCPVCGKEGTELIAFDKFGECSGGCSQLTVDELRNGMIAPAIFERQFGMKKTEWLQWMATMRHKAAFSPNGAGRFERSQ